MGTEDDELDSYLKELRRIGTDLEKAMHVAVRDIDRLGRDALKDATENAKKGGKEAEEALLRLERDLRNGTPSIRREMESVRRHLDETFENIEKEIRRGMK